MSGVKQVIVIRKDLHMRRGKEIAQGAHASMLWLLDRMERQGDDLMIRVGDKEYDVDWLTGNFKKVVCQVDSLEEFYQIQADAKALGVKCYVVTDLGLTEFDGVPTQTALAVGPHYEDQVNQITGHLRLY